MKIEDLTQAHFAAHLNSAFRIRVDEAIVVEAKLTEVSELKESPRQERFSLIFTGPRDPFLPQQMYALDHDGLGAFDLFLVPVGVEVDGFLYEGVFNRLRPTVASAANEPEA